MINKLLLLIIILKHLSRKVSGPGQKTQQLVFADCCIFVHVLILFHLNVFPGKIIYYKILKHANVRYGEQTVSGERSYIYVPVVQWSSC